MPKFRLSRVVNLQTISYVLKYAIEVLPMVKTRCKFFHTSTTSAVCSTGAKGHSKR